MKIIVFILLLLSISTSLWSSDGFTQKDRETLIELKVRVEELRIDMDMRFEQVDKRFEELRMDTNKRFEQVDKRFEQTFTFLWILAGIFTTLTISVIGFAYWDRRTIIRKAKEETIEEIDGDNLKKILPILREMAKNNTNIKKILSKYNLL
ncbi:MAG: hypothetical protein SVZ03_11000 [Spirochaetota bacterium]|nr:hypothetical protein [Spirochaetota bacterium]